MAEKLQDALRFVDLSQPSLQSKHPWARDTATS